MHQLPLRLICIEPEGFHLMFQAYINGLKANVLVDTGASRTILDYSRAEYYLGNPDIRPFEKLFTGVGASGIKTFVCEIPHIRFGNKEIRGQEIVLIDLSPVNKTYAIYDLPRIDMVLGGDLLQKFRASIDYAQQVMLMS